MDRLDGNPGNGDDNVHALCVGRLPLVRVGSVLLVVPEGADGAVHAAAALLLNLSGRVAVVLDDGAVGNVLVRGLRGGVWSGRFRGGRRLADERLENVLLEEEGTRVSVAGHRRLPSRGADMGAYNDLAVPLADFGVVV